MARSGAPITAAKKAFVAHIQDRLENGRLTNEDIADVVSGATVVPPPEHDEKGASMARDSVSLVGRTILAETPDSITVSGTYQSPRLTVGITAITEQLSRCQHCGKTFPQQHKRTMYCSPTCRIRQKHVQRKASGYYVRRRARLKAAREQRTRLGKTWLRNLRTLWWGGSSSKRTMDK